jgi:CRP/FNR family transcriptional regulator
MICASTPHPRAPREAACDAATCGACKLRRLCLPRGIGDDSAFESLQFTRKRVKRGDNLYLAGDGFTALYAVRSGFFKCRVVLEDGRDQVTGFHMEAEVLGMEGMDTGRHSVDAIALEDSEVCIIPAARLQEPVMQRQLQKIMAQELVRDHGVMMLLGTMCAEERLAAFLLNLSQRFLARGFSASEFHLRMKRDEIGSYIGLSLETVSRLFSRFQDQGHIAVQQRHIRILDIPGLRSVMLHTND